MTAQGEIEPTFRCLLDLSQAVAALICGKHQNMMTLKYEYTNTRSLFVRPSARTKLYKIQFIQKYNVESDNYHTLQYCSLRLNA